MASGILIRIGIGIIAATVLAAVVGLFLPSTFEVEKNVVIDATKGTIHEFTGDLTRWPEWTPWLEDNPDMTVTFADQTTGAGAGLTWKDGSRNGRLSFISCDPDLGVEYVMTFEKNTYTSTGYLKYRPAAGGTEVVWTMVGDNGNNILARYFVGLMPSFIGPQFEEALARLKMVAEKAEAVSEAVPES